MTTLAATASGSPITLRHPGTRMWTTVRRFLSSCAGRMSTRRDVLARCEEPAVPPQRVVGFLAAGGIILPLYRGTTRVLRQNQQLVTARQPECGEVLATVEIGEVARVVAPSSSADGGLPEGGHTLVHGDALTIDGVAMRLALFSAALLTDGEEQR